MSKPISFSVSTFNVEENLVVITFGFLQMPSFTLYPKTGEVCVKLEQQHLDCISLEVYRKIDQWHEKLFNHILGFEKCTSLSFSTIVQNRGYRIVPLTNAGRGNWVLDMKLLSNSEAGSQELFTSRQQLQQLEKSDLVGCVVKKSYQENSKQRFRVVAIRHDLNPSSEFPDIGKAATYADYFNSQYNLKIKDLEQPLLEVEPFSRKLNALAKPEEGSRVPRMIQLIPELCSVFSLPSHIWDSGFLLPSVLWRTEQLLVANELRFAIGMEDVASQECSDIGNEATSYVFTSPPMKRKKVAGEDSKDVEAVNEHHKDISNDWLTVSIDFDSSSCESMELEDGEVESSEGEDDEGMPSVFNILTALTAKSSHDLFNLERLEMLGDSFLKLAISVSLFWKYINKHEGQLSKKRSRIVCNAKLFSLARKRNLPLHMFVTEFRPLVMWLPPGFIQLPAVEDAKQAEIGDKPVEYRKQRMSDKCVADCVEALIGAYLRYGGYSSALHFMKWIGIDVHDSVSDVLDAHTVDQLTECISQISTATFYFNSTSSSQRNISIETLSNGFHRFEDSIGYEFKDKKWLLQALTHPSYYLNRVTDSYQRLEFLGDALIDYLVTYQIYTDYDDMNPGELTDLRSALVCNDTFAEIAVERNYHHHLKGLSPRLFKAIDLYVKSKQKDQVSCGDTAVKDILWMVCHHLRVKHMFAVYII